MRRPAQVRIVAASGGGWDRVAGGGVTISLQGVAAGDPDETDFIFHNDRMPGAATRNTAATGEGTTGRRCRRTAGAGRYAAARPDRSAASAASS